MRLLGGITISMEMNLGQLWDIGRDREAMSAAVHGVTKSCTYDYQLTTKVCHSFSSKEEASFNCMAAVTINSDFGAQENKVSHCFHFFPIYLP